MSRPLNLARRPVRNERLPTLLLVVGCAALLVFSVGHAVAARDVLPGRTTNVEREVVTLEGEIERLRVESAELARQSAPSAALREWAVVRGLVDGRAFSWTGLLATLEAIMPPGIRLVTVDPREHEGRVELTVSAIGHSVEDGLAFLKALQGSREFPDAFLTSVSESPQGIEFSYTMRYLPGATPGGKA